jgi:hypothetical protein
MSNKPLSCFIINETISLGYEVVQLFEAQMVRFSMGSLRFLIDLNFLVTLGLWNEDSSSN